MYFNHMEGLLSTCYTEGEREGEIKCIRTGLTIKHYAKSCNNHFPTLAFIYMHACMYRFKKTYTATHLTYNKTEQLTRTQ